MLGVLKTTMVVTVRNKQTGILYTVNMDQCRTTGDIREGIKDALELEGVMDQIISEILNIPLIITEEKDVSGEA